MKDSRHLYADPDCLPNMWPRSGFPAPVFRFPPCKLGIGILIENVDLGIKSNTITPGHLAQRNEDLCSQKCICESYSHFFLLPRAGNPDFF